MKRVLSTGDICAVDNSGDDQCNENSSGVFTQVRRRQNKKSKKADLSNMQTRQAVMASGDASHTQKSEQGRSVTDVTEPTVSGEVPRSLVDQLQKTVNKLMELYMFRKQPSIT